MHYHIMLITVILKMIHTHWKLFINSIEDKVDNIT